jgi:hypothetical protein
MNSKTKKKILKELSHLMYIVSVFIMNWSNVY